MVVMVDVIVDDVVVVDVVVVKIKLFFLYVDQFDPVFKI